MQNDDTYFEHSLQTERQRGGLKPPPSIFGRVESPEVRFVCSYCSKRLTKPNPAYPYLNASICTACIEANPNRLVIEENVINKEVAPWSDEEVESLKQYQLTELLPYICSKGHVLIAQNTGLSCRYCPRHLLVWAYDWTLRYGWK